MVCFLVAFFTQIFTQERSFASILRSPTINAKKVLPFIKTLAAACVLESNTRMNAPPKKLKNHKSTRIASDTKKLRPSFLSILRRFAAHFSAQ
jgi:hypothetical protein